MNIETIIKICDMGDKKGSALRELLMYYGITDYDLSRITEEQAQEWLQKGCGCNDKQDNR